MPQYRCYFLTPENHVTAFALLDCTTDALAQAEADKLRRDRDCGGVELWNGPTMVYHSIEPIA